MVKDSYLKNADIEDKINNKNIESTSYRALVSSTIKSLFRNSHHAIIVTFIIIPNETATLTPHLTTLLTMTIISQTHLIPSLTLHPGSFPYRNYAIHSCRLSTSQSPRYPAISWLLPCPESSICTTSHEE